MADRDLHTLIRLGKWDVDEKRRALGILLRDLYALETEIRKLEAELLNEQAAARMSPEIAGFFYGNYANGVIEKRERLEQATAAMEQKVEEAQEILRQAHGELRKFEMVQENRDKEAAKELARKEQIELDEIGIRAYLRKHAKGRAD